MNIEEYKSQAIANNYKEILPYISGLEVNLKDFVVYKELDVEVQTHLAKVLICRHFSSTGGISLPADVDWFISEFIREYEKDLSSRGYREL